MGISILRAIHEPTHGAFVLRIVDARLGVGVDDAPLALGFGLHVVEGIRVRIGSGNVSGMAGTPGDDVSRA